MACVGVRVKTMITKTADNQIFAAAMNAAAAAARALAACAG